MDEVQFFLLLICLGSGTALVIVMLQMHSDAKRRVMERQRRAEHPSQVIDTDRPVIPVGRRDDATSLLFEIVMRTGEPVCGATLPDGSTEIRVGDRTFHGATQMVALQNAADELL